MNLSEWLNAIESKKPQSFINLGLERVSDIAEHLTLLNLSPAKVITVAGTNGKGSTISALQSLLLASNKKLGVYTSPHLLRFNERIAINGQAAEDHLIVDAFCEINQACKNLDIELTYFEWATLAALYIFKQQSLDYILLEVGLGGRLDAVNVIDADISIITSIDYDHTEFLGDTREAIALEKAGVFRENQLIFCGEKQCPYTLLEKAQTLNSNFNQLGKHYQYKISGDSWNLQFKQHKVVGLKKGNLHLDNLATALACFLELNIDCTQTQIIHSLANIEVKGRQQYISKVPPILLDVAHNPASIKFLTQYLSKLHYKKCSIIFSMLNNKDIQKAIDLLKPYIDKWYIAPIDNERTIKQKQLQQYFQAANITDVVSFNDLTSAYFNAKSKINKDELLIVCGSFFVVSTILKVEQASKPLMTGNIQG